MRPFPVNHPQGAAGYRIESGGASIVYAPDREHGHQKLDAVLREYSRNPDILIHDAQYAPRSMRGSKAGATALGGKRQRSRENAT